MYDLVRDDAESKAGSSAVTGKMPKGTKSNLSLASVPLNNRRPRMGIASINS